MTTVYNALDDKRIYVCDDLDYVKTQLGGGGFAVVACVSDGRIVGSFIMRYPHLSNDNLGRDIDFPESELDRVVHMESAVVLPEYRGNGLQLEMLQYAETLIDMDQYKYLLATVSPKNPASYKTFIKNGYRLIKAKRKYGGLMRGIYLKTI
jgi:ribosomal protein S18 acetylase RimI-like enzyme